MKLKISAWGNSHGVRITSAMMDHLKTQAGDEVDVNLTADGIELIKRGSPLGYLASVEKGIVDSLLAQTSPD